MKSIILLFAFVGCVFTLSPNHEYKYKYEGRIGFGIPEIRNRVTGAGIKATVRLQAVSTERTLVKFEDIEVGEFLGDVQCELRQAMPLRYSRISGQARTLEEPFEVYFGRQQGHVMTVSKSDQEWVTNLRKSIVSFFVVDPMRVSSGAAEESSPLKNAVQANMRYLPKYFAIQEPTLFGNCYSDYSFLPYKFQSESEEHMGYKPEKNEDGIIQLYRMKRSINFNRCSEKVVLQQTGVGNTTYFGANQFGDVSSRSSVMTAQIERMGNNELFRLMKAKVEGHFTLNPFGMNQDKLMSISNQTFQLISVTALGSPFKLPPSTKPIRTWLMEVASPFEAPSVGRPSWVNFYNKPEAKYEPFLSESISTGIEVDSATMQKFTANLDSMIEEAASLMLSVSPLSSKDEISPFATYEARIISHLESSFRLAKGIDVKSLESLFEKYFQDSSEKSQMKLKLFIDVCSTSGVGAPLKMLLNQMEKNKVSPERIASIFFTLPNNLVETPVIDDLAKYVKTLNIQESPFLASTVWINYASVLNRVCLNRRTWNYTIPHTVFGRQDCSPSKVVNDILPFFKSQMQKAQETYERVIIVHAIGNLGTHEAVSFLNSVVRDRSLPPQVRAAAIYSLTRSKLPREMKDVVFRNLMPIVEGYEQRPYVRQAALAALVTWRPSASWWQRIGVSTWREPSNDVASFIYTLLESVAHNTDPFYRRERNIAQFVQPLAKPYTPSWRYSQNYFFGGFNPKKIMSTDTDASILREGDEVFPRELFGFIMNSFGGLRFSLMEVSYSSKFSYVPALKNVLEDILKYLPEGSKIRSAESRRAEERYGQDASAASRLLGADDQYSNIFFSMFDNLEIIAPFSKETVKKLMEGGVSRFLKRMSEGKELHLTKFFNPAPIEMFVPSEVGLPVFAKLSVPTVNGGEGKSVLQVDGQECSSIQQLFNAKQISFNVTTNYKFATKTLASLRALVPWSQHLVASGVESLKSVTLPVNFRFNVDMTAPEKNFSAHIVPTHHKAFPVVQAHTIPFVVRKSMWPGKVPQEFLQFEIISVLGGNKGVEEQQIKFSKSYTGLEGGLRWEGDVAFPFTLGNLISFYQHLDRFSELLTSPTVRLWSTTVHLNFGESETKEIHPSLFYAKPTGQFEKRKLMVPPPPNPNPFTEMFVTHLFLNGTEERAFEAGVLIRESLEQANSSDKYGMFTYYTRSPLKGYDPKPVAYCFNLELTTPAITSLESLRQILKQQVQTEIVGNIMGHGQCKDELVQFTGKLEVSSDRRKRLSSELQTVCEYDPIDPMSVFTTSPVYDEASLNIKYREPVDRQLLNVSYHVYDVIRGWSFPHIYFNYMNGNNPAGRINVSGRRYLGENQWRLNSLLPTENIVFDRFTLPHFFDQIIPIGGLSHAVRRADAPVVMFQRQLSQMTNQCTVDTNGKVLSFDKYWYTYAPQVCPTKIVMNRYDESAPMMVAGLDRKTKKYTGVVSSSFREMTISFDSKSLRVNGETVPLNRTRRAIYDKEGKYFAGVLTVRNYVEVAVPGNFTVRLSDDKIWVIPYPGMAGSYGGICGTYLRKSEKELIGPKNCLFSDDKLFGYAWSDYSRKECNSPFYRQQKLQVMKFQENCTKPKNMMSLSSESSFRVDPIPDDCLDFVYRIKKSVDICVSQTSVGICLPGCKLVDDALYDEVYDCWPKEYAPKELLQNLKRGYIRNKIPYRPIVTMTFKTDHARICSKK